MINLQSITHINFICLLVLPDRISIDKGTETGEMVTIHSYLRSKQGDLEDATESIIYGPSTQNKIERWWRELLEQMEKSSCPLLQKVETMIQVMKLTGHILFALLFSVNFVFSFLLFTQLMNKILLY